LTGRLLIVVAVSYLLGSIPFGYLLVQMFRGEDIRKTGSGNIGATNVARSGSRGLAVATLLLDALKGYAAVAFAFWSAGRGPLRSPFSTGIYESGTQVINGETVFFVAALAAFVVILGHMFTVWLRFKGGKGVATSAGAFLALTPQPMLVALGLFVLIVAVTRYVSLGSIIAGAAFPWCVWWLGPAADTSALILLLIAASSLLVILRHKDNIRRLLAGTEHRFR